MKIKAIVLGVLGFLTSIHASNNYKVSYVEFLGNPKFFSTLVIKIKNINTKSEQTVVKTFNPQVDSHKKETTMDGQKVVIYIDSDNPSAGEYSYDVSVQIGGKNIFDETYVLYSSPPKPCEGCSEGIEYKNSQRIEFKAQPTTSSGQNSGVQFRAQPTTPTGKKSGLEFKAAPH